MLKLIKILDGDDADAEEITIAINRDKVVEVRSADRDGTEIVLDGNTRLRTKQNFKATLKALS